MTKLYRFPAPGTNPLPLRVLVAGGLPARLTVVTAVSILVANKIRQTIVRGGVALMSTNEAIIGRAERLPVTGLHRRIMVILGFGTFFDAFDTLAIASALTVIFSSLHIDFLATGMLIGAGYVGQFIGALLFGVLSEVWGRKKSFIVALFVMGLFSIGAALSWNLQSLALSRALLGIGLGAEAPIAGTMIVELLQRHRRGGYFLTLPDLVSMGHPAHPASSVLPDQRVRPRSRMAHACSRWAPRRYCSPWSAFGGSGIGSMAGREGAHVRGRSDRRAFRGERGAAAGLALASRS